MGFLLSFEGIDGSGKTTQIDKTAAWLREKKYDLLVCREPGGTELGEAIRTILLDPRWKEMSPRTEFLLYSASRAQLIDEKVIPHLARERSVAILDRYYDSSSAYQGGGRKLSVAAVSAIHPFATAALVPNLTLYLDVDWPTSVERRRHEVKDRLEQNAHDFFDRVRETYLDLCRREPERVKLIDARGEVDEIFQRIQTTITTCLN